MCQINNVQKRFAAGTICYKVLYNSTLRSYISMYQMTPWTLGQIHKTFFYNHKLNSHLVKTHYSSFDRISIGFFHAFSTLEEAIRFQKTIQERQCCSFYYVTTNYPIAEMRIPEDVNGFSGIYSDCGESFNSITVPILEFVKIVDQNVSDK